MQPTWDLFCRVIDNYGDIGVCWRLARQLAREHGLRVVEDAAHAFGSMAGNRLVGAGVVAIAAWAWGTF